MPESLASENSSKRLSLEGSSNEEPEQIQQLRRATTENDDYNDSTTRQLSRVPTSIQDDVLQRFLAGNVLKNPGTLPEMGENKPYPPALPEDRSPYRVEFSGPDDPAHPLNWPMKRKLPMAAALAFVTMNVAFASAIYGSAVTDIKQVFHVGTAVAELGVCFFVIGFAAGPCMWGPMSEYYGRKIPLVISSILLVCFSFATATAKDFQTLVICRFFGGITGSAPLSIVPGIFADMFDASTRGSAASIFSLCVCGGPMLAPVIGSFITASYLSWRWCLYLSGIMSALSLAFVVFLAEETYHPIILARKAQELRRRTGNWGIFAKHETISLDLNQMATTAITRPIKMLIQEPILFLLSLYGGFVYGLLYMSLSAYPLVFRLEYGWTSGVVGLPYLSLLIGCSIATITLIFVFEPRYIKKLKASGLPAVPEERLTMMMVAAPVFSIGIFWMFWTGAYPKTAEHPNGCHFMLPVVGGALFGFGFLGIFMPMINYVLDSYLMLAASGMAANTFLRSAMGAAFPLFATQMFMNLGVQWAGTLVGCLSVLMLPIPFLFYKFGEKLRSKSKYAVNLKTDAKEAEIEEVEEKEHDQEARASGSMV